MSIEFPYSSDQVDGMGAVIPASSQDVSLPNKIKEDPTLSTIEASQIVAALLIPLVSVPMLIPPTKNAETIQGLGSILNSMSERKKMDFLFSLSTQVTEITTHLNQIFMDSLDKIIEETRRILNSTSYRDEKEFRRQSRLPDEGKDEISGLASTAEKVELQSKIKTSNDESLSSIQGIDKLSHELRGMEKLDIPFTVLFTVAGTLALGKLSSENESAGDLVKLIQQLHPLVPEVKIEEIIPIINLMVMAPIIFRPLDEAMQHQKGGQRANYAQLIPNFAKDVIKMVTDPTFALLNIVNNIEQMDHLNPKQKQEFVALLKLILLSVALSLMYSLEVGKIQGDKFLGMEELEFKALLDPEKPLIKQKPEKEMSSNDRLIHSLVNQIRLQMADIPVEERSEAIQAILNFLKQNRRVDKLLEPSKVLTGVLEAMDYKIPLSHFITV